MNYSHVQGLNHMSHDKHHQHHHHHHHSNTFQKESLNSQYNHLSTNDHHSMMKMSFHTGFIETILFEVWTTTTIPLFISSWILIFILGILYEGIREIRQYLEEQQSIRNTLILDTENVNELEPMNTESTVQVKRKILPPCTVRALHSLVYMIHLTFSYILMLIAMTFNVYLFLAIIFGVGTGHLLCTWTHIIPTTTSKNQRET